MPPSLGNLTSLAYLSLYGGKVLYRTTLSGTLPAERAVRLGRVQRRRAHQSRSGDRRVLRLRGRCSLRAGHKCSQLVGVEMPTTLHGRPNRRGLRPVRVWLLRRWLVVMPALRPVGCLPWRPAGRSHINSLRRRAAATQRRSAVRGVPVWPGHSRGGSVCTVQHHRGSRHKPDWLCVQRRPCARCCAGYLPRQICRFLDRCFHFRRGLVACTLRLCSVPRHRVRVCRVSWRGLTARPSFPSTSFKITGALVCLASTRSGLPMYSSYRCALRSGARSSGAGICGGWAPTGLRRDSWLTPSSSFSFFTRAYHIGHSQPSTAASSQKICKCFVLTTKSIAWSTPRIASHRSTSGAFVLPLRLWHWFRSECQCSQL
eukprot:SAG22_NODE_329_length_12249_cov_27.341646_8_plen_372_part_00